ncbi:hypothetical protein PROAA_890001 [Candidatus Propionivibrio aalborgensis]|uniref:Uncharacterized protein n=1 Tax=Candidatus Propionivibrio aalborgensis TaxID=1860101 RepID=A0A1A8Y1S3_9RHOO|nr:hypothetical protein PROAA_890001 [Candidatus Propionivibrio aalborgensis]
MRFEEAYGGWQHGRLTQLEAASLLGVSDRTFRRYLGRYEEGGLEGLIDHRIGRIRERAAIAGSRVGCRKPNWSPRRRHGEPTVNVESVRRGPD